MESAQLLDLLGNENRRKILHLLASRPCYMSEIAERLDVGAKAILGHLLLLERSGIIESNVDEQRRKYFRITDNLRLEVFVSPYSFELETTTVIITEAPEHQRARIDDLKTLYSSVRELLEERRLLMQEYQKVQTEITEAMGQYMDYIGEVADDHFEAEILYALIKGPMDERVLSKQLGIPEYMLEGYLDKLESKNIIKKELNNYKIA
jgi:ArsR family transcriptional regulator